MTTSLDLNALKHIRFVSQELEWSESMKESVWQKIIEPLDRALKTPEFDLSLHWDRDSRHEGEYVFSLILQTFDGHRNRVVRAHGREFLSLVHEASRTLRQGLRKSRTPGFSFFGLRPGLRRSGDRLI